ncbi:MAG: hypothetical protein IPJ41_14640 [Phycisphaerales bacterium]|nr:hypothetical protein [Phycisphaerales bacterium]
MTARITAFVMFALAWLATPAAGQVTPLVTVGPRVRVNDPIQHPGFWFECSLAASQVDPNRVVFASRKEGGAIGYAIGSVDALGTLSVSDLGNMPYADSVAGEVRGGDPGLVCAPGSGQIWICAIHNAIAIEQGLVGAWLDPTDSSIPADRTYRITGAVDKPLMAAGPSAFNGQTLYHVLYNFKSNSPLACSNDLWDAASTDPEVIDPFWALGRVRPDTQAHQCDYRGWGATPVVLDTGPNAGRVVVAVTDPQACGGGCYNEDLPYVVYSDTDGATWLPDFGQPVEVDGNATIEATTVTASWGTPGDTPYAVDRRWCHPAMAVDPNNGDVYVAFYARSQPGSTNTDIHIAQSRWRRVLRGPRGGSLRAHGSQAPGPRCPGDKPRPRPDHAVDGDRRVRGDQSRLLRQPQRPIP